jgi:hypothetical protein
MASNVLDIAMRAEYDAWRHVVQHWPGSIDDPKFNKLVKAIELWGEYLVALRMNQDALKRARILLKKKERYENE